MPKPLLSRNRVITSKDFIINKSTVESSLILACGELSATHSEGYKNQWKDTLNKANYGTGAPTLTYHIVLILKSIHTFIYTSTHNIRNRAVYNRYTPQKSTHTYQHGSSLHLISTTNRYYRRPAKALRGRWLEPELATRFWEALLGLRRYSCRSACCWAIWSASCCCWAMAI